MRRYALLALSLLGLVGCSTTESAHHSSADDSPETVLVTYHIKSGKEVELETILSRAWEIYRKERLVFATPHIIVRETEEGNKVRFVEVFTWVSHAAPEHASESVQKIWEQEHSLCEEGNIEINEVELVVPARR